MTDKRPSFDTLFGWILTLLLVLLVLSFFVGCKQQPKPQQQTYNIDSLRKVHKQLIDCDNGLETLEDSIHEFEDGF